MPRPASINTAYPINWTHPLNRGLVSWWVGLPYGSGGLRFRDLCGRNHGTLSSVSPTWVADPNGFRALSFDAVNTDVDISSIPTSYSNGLSFSLAIAPDATGGTRRDYFGRWADAGSNFQFLLTSGIAASQWSFYTYVGGSFKNATGGTVTVGRFTRIMATHDNSTMRLYVDGLLVAAAGAVGNVGTYSNNAYIGRSGSVYGGGTISDVSLWDRALSDSEALADYHQWRQKIPDRLNRNPQILTVPVATANVAGPLVGGKLVGRGILVGGRLAQ